MSDRDADIPRLATLFRDLLSGSTFSSFCSAIDEMEPEFQRRYLDEDERSAAELDEDLFWFVMCDARDFCTWTRIGRVSEAEARESLSRWIPFLDAGASEWRSTVQSGNWPFPAE